jgi:hypothetical protein
MPMGGRSLWTKVPSIGEWGDMRGAKAAQKMKKQTMKSGIAGGKRRLFHILAIDHKEIERCRSSVFAFIKKL